MKLSDALKDIEYTLVGGDIEISGIAYDSRRVEKGSLFVAVRGFETDGHLYINKAIENGAAAIVAQELPASCPVPVALAANTRRALAQISASFYGYPAKKMKIIGVTGTNGKTTTTYLIKKILDLKGIKTGLIGTNQNMIGDEVIRAGRTTPESAELQRLLAEMQEAGVTHVVMEVSSHALALDRTWGIEFEAGVFTNLTPEHLDFHDSMQDYCSAKATLFSQSRLGAVNADDEWAELIIRGASARVITYGIEEECDIRAENVRLSERGVFFNAAYKGARYEVRLAIPGRFSVYNALASISACLLLDIEFEDILKGLVLAKGVKGRAEVVPLPADYTVIIDYAHTPDGLENIINTVRDFVKGRIITLFGCGGDRDKAKRPVMGEIAARLSDFAIVTSDNPRSEDPLAIIGDIVEGMEEYHGKYAVVADRTAAVRHSLEMAEAGDVIILAGKGHETYQILADKTIDYDERVIVREIYEQINS